MTKTFILLSIISTAILGCEKKPNLSSEDYLIERTVLFYLKDKVTGENLIGNANEMYNPDSIQITMGALKGRTILDSSGQYYAGIRYLLQMATKEENINSFYIDLPVFIYLNQRDTDTIQIKKEFNQQIKFFYNDRFIDSIPALNKNIPVLTINK